MLACVIVKKVMFAVLLLAAKCTDLLLIRKQPERDLVQSRYGQDRCVTSFDILLSLYLPFPFLCCCVFLVCPPFVSIACLNSFRLRSYGRLRLPSQKNTYAHEWG